jgi:hypothetical protein
MNKEYNRKTTDYILYLVLFVILFISINYNQNKVYNNSNDIITVDQKIINDRERIYNLEMENEKLKQLIIETSDIPNEKRKAIFKLKIEQDSVLINLLENDIRTNKAILKLLDKEWVFNNDTEFTSLKE